MQISDNPREALVALAIEVERLQDEVSLLKASFDVTTKVPLKPRAGMLRFADGVGWNPGGGAGFYQYVGGGWVKL